MGSQGKKIFEIIVMCIEELNKQLPPEGRVANDGNTAIVGGDSVLDSLGIVTLFVNIESRMSEQGIDCNLMDELLAEYDVHPFETIGSIANWIENADAHES